jgi:hypothetical protein
VSYASERVLAGTHTVEQVEQIWGDKLVFLWIIAKGWAAPNPKLGETPDDKEVDGIFIEKVTRLAEKEDEASQAKKARVGGEERGRCKGSPKKRKPTQAAASKIRHKRKTSE